MRLHIHKNGPRAFGFEIYGNGPCYVIHVEKGSIAYKAGLMPGDQLLEVNGHDVMNMTAKQVKALVKNGSKQPPELEVVSCLKTHVIEPQHVSGFGFKVSNKRPVTIASVEYGGPAHQSGLRVGDIILETNSHIATGVNALATVLSQQQGRLTLLTIPVARTSNMVQVDKTLSRIPQPDPRIFRAKDLHNRLEILMGNDYKRKMAVVAALKQYAEDRDITVLCSALMDVLGTKPQRNILKHIRLIQVLREAGSFGFVIKSCSPAFIESIDQGGAAEKAGLQPGDYLIKLNGIDIRKCDHDRLVELLQDSGSCPTLEVLRCSECMALANKGKRPQVAGSTTTGTSAFSSAGVNDARLSSSSSSSSHNSADNIIYSNVIVDKQGNTFSEKTKFLLTSKELTTLKKAVRTYDTNRDIIILYDSLSAILDTPSKKMLWPFLFVLLSSPHREYVTHHVNMPFEVLMGIVKSDGDSSFDGTDGPKLDPQEPDFPSSFKQQADFLLTPGELSQFKKSLEEYKNKYDLKYLKMIESILDTRSKKILWKFVLPHMNGGHKEIMRERLDLHGQNTASLSSVSVRSLDSYIGSAYYGTEEANVERASHTEDDILYGGSQLQFRKSSESSSDESDYSDSPPRNRKLMKGKPNSTSNDSSVIRELKETKKSVQDVPNALLLQEKYKDDESALHNTVYGEDMYLDSRYVTIIPVGSPSQKQDQLPYRNNLVNTTQLSSLRKVKVHSRTYDEASNAQNTSVFHTDNDSLVSSSSDDDSVKGMEVGYDLVESKYSRQFCTAASATQQLDEAVLHKTVFGDVSPRSLNFDLNTENRDGELELVKKTEYNRQHYQQPPPPPPPPLSFPGLGIQENSNKMNVKRINWEKLDNKSVQNTIWEKLSDHDLSEVIRYLELETQFSTKPSQHKESVTRKELLIMDKKKAYNISILLGHLKMPVSDVKKALYSMDEKTLSPELLGQLLAFAPNEHEISQYRLYKGDTSFLTKPDQFAYQMSLVEDYEDRLKALRFKASFKEKVEEIKGSLESIKSASLELRNSKKLAHLLEIILAMGNHMNKGLSRIGQAAGFRITFLTQLDVTKTADKKSSFLHVLANAAYNKFPDTLALADELPTVEKAAKVSFQTLMQDIQDIKKSLKDTSAVLDRLSNHAQNSEPEDQFQEVMGHLMAQATEENQSIFRMQTSAMEEFSTTVTFFGEDPNTMTTNEVFGIFADFIKNFEKAHRQNLMFKRQ